MASGSSGAFNIIATTQLVLASPSVIIGTGAADVDYKLTFDGDDSELAKLNASLVQANLGVVLIEEDKKSLHELYYSVVERTEDACSS